MIIDETSVGRYAFIFDINDLTPFRGVRYYPFAEEMWFPKPIFSEITDEEYLIGALDPMVQWLGERTSAYRIRLIQMSCHHPRVSPFPTYGVTALMVQMPDSLATLFHMFWYG